MEEDPGARAACFCERLQSATIAANRAGSSAETRGQTVCAIRRRCRNGAQKRIL